MIVVIVELWPDGDPARATEIGRAGLADVAPCGDVASYVAVVEDELAARRVTFVAGQSRSGSVWTLLARSLSEFASKAPPWHARTADRVAVRMRNRRPN
jgi:hypothetical protein